jgi:hypothetical protein
MQVLHFDPMAIGRGARTAFFVQSRASCVFGLRLAQEVGEAAVRCYVLACVNRKKPMSEENRELLGKLKFELAFVADGGYGRSVRTPHKPTSPFQDSLTCLNFGDPARTHPCAECTLMQYVPESRKGEDVPCHYIPLDEQSRTIATLDAAEADEVLKQWLRHEIDRLEREVRV